MPEYILSGNTWSEGTEFSQEDANALMVDYRESTSKNHDEDFYRIVEGAMKEPSKRLSNCSTLLKEKIISVCVKINEERRWAIDVYLNTGISMFITMQLLQSLPARVLTVMKNKITANHTTFNEILHLQMMNLIAEKLPEVYTNPFCVYYEGTTKSGSRRCAYMSLGGTSTMESRSILKVLDMILNSKANKERVLAVKAIYDLLVKRDKELSSTMKKMISKANSNKVEQGENCSYDVPFDDDDDDEAGNASGSTSGNVGSKSQEENKEETPVQEKKDAGVTKEEESVLIETLEANILRCVVDSINAEKDTVSREAVTEDTVNRDTVTEDTVKKDTVREDTVNKDAVKDEFKPTVKPKRTKSLSKAWFSRQEPEPEETTKARKEKHKYSGNEKATGLGRKLRKPIQSKLYISLDLLEKEAAQIRNVEVKLDNNKEATEYVLWFDVSRLVMVKKDFTMEVTSHDVSKTLSYSRRKETRRIDYFYFVRMVNLMQGYDNVPENVMNHVLAYKAVRDEEFYQKFGEWSMFDDADIAHLLEYSEEEIVEYEDDLPEEEVQSQPSKEGSSNPTGRETTEDMEDAFLNKSREANKVESEGPNYQSCMLENPLRIKFIWEEIPVSSFHKLKTSALKDLLYLVNGSIHLLEQQCSSEIEGILQMRKGEDSKLDKSRRKTLNAYPRSRFKDFNGTLKFRTHAFGKDLWMDLQDARVCLSKTIRKHIDEIEDEAITSDEIALVEGLREVLKEALNIEDEGRHKRNFEAK
ncbi:hypothetical protein POM88_039542 [Heracleum sosnowskyi]|uniref:Uncharacterized protein n=1 Tax=Heracleum sosnowskyi TaxID=360622 RepID=A0AAD8HBK6_9APIA|nr:hypothetical protein POM88_039542 [Heracleum sosnowskyi]